jgi:hypothetical protein
MKKVLLVAVAGLFVLASCKKDYTCECTVTLLGTSQTVSTEYKDVKKKDATETCDKSDVAGMSECSIK